MDISRIKSKKPWFVPQWLWNSAVNTMCDAAKENLKVESVAEFVGDAAIDGLCKAVDGKSGNTVETVCAIVENGGHVFTKAANAARDGKITDEEKFEVSASIRNAAANLVPQERIDEKIEEIRSALLFG